MGERCETSLLLSGVKCRSASLQLRAFYFSFCEHHCLKLFIVIIMICSVFIYYIYEALCCNTVAAVCCQGLSVAVCQCELMLWGVLSVWTDAVRCVVSVNWCCEVWSVVNVNWHWGVECCQCELTLRCDVAACQGELMQWVVDCCRISGWTDSVRCGVLQHVSMNCCCDVLQHVSVNWCCEVWCVAACQCELMLWGVMCCSMSVNWCCVFQEEESGEIIFYLKGADTVMQPIVQYNDWLEEEVSFRVLFISSIIIVIIYNL